MSSTEPKLHRPAGLALPLQPLDELYAHQGLPLPPIEQIAGAEVPEPFRTLLVHRNDMTPTLERFHGERIHIQVLRRERQGDTYVREVVLRLDDSEAPVEFGANRVRLDLFSPEARWMILQEKLPLGRILKEHAVPHTSRPAAFFRVQSDALINRALGLPAGTQLYGRKVTISDPQGRPLSEVVEILPPME